MSPTVDVSKLVRGPVQGKTYSLYGGADTSDAYFRAVANVATACLDASSDLRSLISTLQRESRRPRRLRHLRKEGYDTLIGLALRLAHKHLSRFLLDVESHRSALSFAKRFRGTLGTTREQYLLYAVEIELMNRLHVSSFGQRKDRIALLPHCLHDLSKTCEARPHGVDNVCVACSSGCYINAVSSVLRRHGVRPFIWMQANLRRLLRAGREEMAVLGIACIPELVHGMRTCSSYGVPVLGLPLDANRCVRWLGDFHDNTVNLAHLESLLEARTNPSYD
jgi:hypothetical protein